MSNAFRQQIHHAKSASTIALTLTASSLVGASVLIPNAAPEFRVFVGGAGVTAGAIAFLTQKQESTWHQTSNQLQLASSTLFVAGCISLVCAAATPNKPEYYPLNLLSIGTAVIAFGVAKQSAIATAAISPLVDEEHYAGFEKEYENVVKQPQQPKQQYSPNVVALPPSQSPKISVHPTTPVPIQQPQQQPSVQTEEIQQVSPIAPADAVVEEEAVAVEVMPEAQIQDGRIELIGSELLAALSSYGFKNVSWLGAIVSPNFIRCLIDPGKGVSITSLKSIAQDLGRVLHLENPLYPDDPVIPFIGQQPGAVTIDIPRPDRETVYFSQYFPPQPTFENPPGLKLAIGVNIKGELVYIDLSNSNTPHVLMGGTTGSGKSETQRTMVASGMWLYSPDRLQFTIIDVKRVTFPEFKDTAHVKAIIKTPEEAIKVLEDAVQDMDKRYDSFEKIGVKNLDEYCQKTGEILPRHIIAIDEFADFMSDKKLKPQLEGLIKRLGAVARGAGIHVIAGTQRPSADVVTPLIRSNLPAIIGLRVGRDKDSAIVFGLEGYKDLYYLLGQGDLIYNQGFQRLQTPYFDLGKYLEENKVIKAEEKLLDKHFTNKVEFVADRRDRFELFRLNLPTHPGVYCVSDGEIVYYVGCSENINRRWTDSRYPHHWLPVMFELLRQGKKLFIHSKIVLKNWQDQEQFLIQELRPEWNGKDPTREITDMKRSQQVNVAPQIQISDEEKQRILECKEKGMNQTDTIYHIWGVQKSGSDLRYRAYRDKYQFVVNQNQSMA